MAVVAVIAIIRPAVNGEALHTVVVEQYRPPVGTYVVGKNVRRARPWSLECSPLPMSVNSDIYRSTRRYAFYALFFRLELGNL